MASPDPLAHSANAGGRTHALAAHLRGVADLAASFASAFGGDSYAECAGLWHDLGKNAPDFQARLAAAADAHVEDDKVPGRVDHSSAGAVHALEFLKRGLGLPLAFVIAGHHAGLADLTDLDARLADPAKKARLAAALSNPAAVVPTPTTPAPPEFLKSATGMSGQELKRRYEFWVRMLFSCLIDADRLDTDAHFDPDRTGLTHPSPQHLRAPAGITAARTPPAQAHSPTERDSRRTRADRGPGGSGVHHGRSPQCGPHGGHEPDPTTWRVRDCGRSTAASSPTIGSVPPPRDHLWGATPTGRSAYPTVARQRAAGRPPTAAPPAAAVAGRRRGAVVSRFFE